jgi:hypothetical protein
MTGRTSQLTLAFLKTSGAAKPVSGACDFELIFPAGVRRVIELEHEIA